MHARTLPTPVALMNSAGIAALYGGSVAIAVALVIAGFSTGPIRHFAFLGTGLMSDAIIRMMSAVQALV